MPEPPSLDPAPRPEAQAPGWVHGHAPALASQVWDSADLTVTQRDVRLQVMDYETTGREQAFLALIRYAEFARNVPADPYRVRNGGMRFHSLATHPGPGAPPARSSAAGAYQILVGTYQDAVRKGVARDFSESSQDAIARWLIERGGATASIQGGDLDTTFARLNRTWTSLPHGAQQQLGAEEAKRYFWTQLTRTSPEAAVPIPVVA